MSLNQVWSFYWFLLLNFSFFIFSIGIVVKYVYEHPLERIERLGMVLHVKGPVEAKETKRIRTVEETKGYRIELSLQTHYLYRS